MLGDKHSALGRATSVQPVMAPPTTEHSNITPTYSTRKPLGRGAARLSAVFIDVTEPRCPDQCIPPTNPLNRIQQTPLHLDNLANAFLFR